MKKLLNVFSKKEKKTTTSELDLKKELIDELVEKGKKNSILTYEEVIDFGEKHHLSEQETNDLLRLLDKEHIDLVTQEELDKADIEATDFDKEDESISHPSRLKSKLESSLDLEAEDLEEEEEEEEEEEKTKEAASVQITDGVKSYLRDIGKIPLLNKKTETTIADMIFSSKIDSIEAISKFPFIHKEFLMIG